MNINIGTSWWFLGDSPPQTQLSPRSGPDAHVRSWAAHASTTVARLPSHRHDFNIFQPPVANPMSWTTQNHHKCGFLLECLSWIMIPVGKFNTTRWNPWRFLESGNVRITSWKRHTTSGKFRGKSTEILGFIIISPGQLPHVYDPTWLTSGSLRKRTPPAGRRQRLRRRWGQTLAVSTWCSPELPANKWGDIPKRHELEDISMGKIWENELCLADLHLLTPPTFWANFAGI